MSNSQTKAWMYPLLGAGLILLAWAVTGFGVILLTENTEKAGAIGDAYGLTNAMFSALAFGGVLYALHLQRHELELQREEMRGARTEFERSASAQEQTQEAMHEQVRFQHVTARIQGITVVLQVIEEECARRASLRQSTSDLTAERREYYAELRRLLAHTDFLRLSKQESSHESATTTS